MLTVKNISLLKHLQSQGNLLPKCNQQLKKYFCSSILCSRNNSNLKWDWDFTASFIKYCFALKLFIYQPLLI